MSGSIISRLLDYTPRARVQKRNSLSLSLPLRSSRPETGLTRNLSFISAFKFKFPTSPDRRKKMTKKKLLYCSVCINRFHIHIGCCLISSSIVAGRFQPFATHPRARNNYVTLTHTRARDDLASGEKTTVGLVGDWRECMCIARKSRSHRLVWVITMLAMISQRIVIDRRSAFVWRVSQFSSVLTLLLAGDMLLLMVIRWIFERYICCCVYRKCSFRESVVGISYTTFQLYFCQTVSESHVLI